MKKLLSLIALPFICFLALSAQITQERADEIVLERSNQEHPFIVYAKEISFNIKDLRVEWSHNNFRLYLDILGQRILYEYDLEKVEPMEGIIE